MVRPASPPGESIEALDGGPVASVPIELVTSWLDGKRANTRDAYATDLALFIAWCAGQGLQPLTATPADIDAFINAQVTTSGSTTVARRVSTLASWYRHLVAIGRATVSPLDQVSRPSRAGYGKERRTLSASDLDRLRAQADADIMSAAQGARADTYLTALCRGAILRMFIGTDIGPGLIVRLNVDDLASGGEGEPPVMWLHIAEGTRYRHEVPVDAAAAIQTYLAARAHTANVGIHELAGPLFVTGDAATGARLGPATPAAMIRRVATAAGLDDPSHVSPAVLRRSPGLALTRRIAAPQVEEPHWRAGDVRARYLRRWVDDPFERDPAILMGNKYGENSSIHEATSARPTASATASARLAEPTFSPTRSARRSQRSSASRDSGRRPTARQPASTSGPVRVLPRDVAPFRDETVRSYEARLAVANHLSVADLRAAAGCRGPLSVDGLSALTGRATRALLMALPELRAAQHRLDLPLNSRWPHPPTLRNAQSGRSALIRPACRRCTAARGAVGEVLTWTPSDVQICLRHGLWIGGQDPFGQWDLGDLPQLAAAQRHHTNLVRRHGRPAEQIAYRQAVHVTAWWARHGCWSDGALARRQVLTGVTGSTPHDADPIIALMYYPEAVGLLSLFVSPYWIRLLSAQPRRDLWDSPLTRRFYAEVRRRTGYDVTGAAVRPLRRWCEQIGVRAASKLQVAP